MFKKTTLLLCLVYLVFMLVFMVVFMSLLSDPVPAEESSRPGGEKISHIHGLAVDPLDSNFLLVATHHGLFRCRQGGECLLLGEDRSDFMGFSVSGDGKIFYVSGHDAATHQNMGLKRSADRGKKWEVMAFDGRVDFHTMTVSPSNPNVIYGWYGRFYKSGDGGKTWSYPEGKGLPPPSEHGPYSPFINILTDPGDIEKVFAATEQGLYLSNNGGGSWSPVKTIPPVPVVSIAIDRVNRNISYLFVYKKGLMKSIDGMKTWKVIGKGIPESEITGNLAIDPKNKKIIYAASFESNVYRSDDGGENFKLIIGK